MYTKRAFGKEHEVIQVKGFLLIRKATIFAKTASFKEAPNRPSYPEAAGLRHLAFALEDIVEAVRDLTSKGIEVEKIRVDPYTSKRYTFFADSDGLPIELYEK
ncbi:VOC family protein [Bacillus sp. 2205SS5-2]|uniref:VOC family protein n=1 Tax=Bacillus sp. 2205SS5-2 TaxID=3109031 RepID=UPI0030057724